MTKTPITTTNNNKVDRDKDGAQQSQSISSFASAALATTPESPSSLKYSSIGGRAPLTAAPPPPVHRHGASNDVASAAVREDGNDNNSNNNHSHQRSWSGNNTFLSFSTDIFSSPLLGGGGGGEGGFDAGRKRCKEMVAQRRQQQQTQRRRRSLEESQQEFHDQNIKFLIQAEKQKSRMVAPPLPPTMSLISNSSSNITSHRSPSPGRIRKRTLASIEENGWNEILAKAAQIEEEDEADTNTNDVAQNVKREMNYRINNNNEEDVVVGEYNNFDDDDSEGERIRNLFSHVRVNSDEMSALTTNSWFSAFGRRSNSGMGHAERLAQFEREQQERFDLKKKDLGTKLGNVLDRRNLTTEKEKKDFIAEYMEELERERATLMAQWKAELQEEQSRLHQPFWIPLYQNCFEPCVQSIVSILATAEVFIANLPLTIGAVGLSWVTMGTVWFKFMEENNDKCIPVHYYSPQCTFPEFPGCFECDTSLPKYQLALKFHYLCSTVAATCCILFALKVVLAWRVVADELSNPTTSTPIGVVCIATVCAFAGQGRIGEGIVLAASGFHCIMAFWFLYMAIFRFGLWPDPGWFPNTVGLSYAAVKTWLYFPTPGLFLLVLALIFFFTIFFVSVVRVALNKKIAAPVCWITLSAPSITLYGFTLVSQPYGLQEKALESDAALLHQKHEWMVTYFLPMQHTFMILSLIGLISAVHGVASRWEAFSKKPFNPAYAAFCFPTLSHTNAVQAYRSGVNAFSSFPPGSPFKVILYGYWVFFLVVGTILNLVITFMYVKRLPEWTKVDTMGEDEPPAPEDTFVKEMLEGTGAHEVFDQSFVSPAVLQANEAGSLVRVRRGTEDYRLYGPYIRTRKVTALGFDPTMDDDELRREHAELLDWVAKNAPRTRNRTMSNPLILRARGQDGVGRDLLYGTFQHHHHHPPRGGAIAGGRRHKRAITSIGVPGV